jgi:zinc protease
LIGWKIPPRRSPEFNALYLAGKVLYEGESSRLYQKLVKGEESVIQLFGFTDERRGPSSIFVGAIPKPEEDLSAIREIIMEEIQDLSVHGPTTAEMEKIENQLVNDTVRMRQSSLSRAQQIAEFTLYDGDPGLVNSELDDLLAVKCEHIRLTTAHFLNTDNRALLDVVPAGKG